MARDDISSFLTFIQNILTSVEHNKEYWFPESDDLKAKITFFPPKAEKLSHLTLGGSGMLPLIHSGRRDKDQISQSMRNATFTSNTSPNNINIIVLDAENTDDIVIGESLYGTELQPTKSGMLYRSSDGLFLEASFASKVAAVIALHRAAFNPICTYKKHLFVNEECRFSLENIIRLVPCEITFRYNTLIEPEYD